MPIGQGTQKVSKMAEKQGFWGFDKYPNHLCIPFCMEHENTNSLLTFCKKKKKKILGQSDCLIFQN